MYQYLCDIFAHTARSSIFHFFLTPHLSSDFYPEKKIRHHLVPSKFEHETFCKGLAPAFESLADAATGSRR